MLPYTESAPVSVLTRVATTTGARPVGQPHLLAVEHEVVAVLHGTGLDRRDVGAAARLAHRERAADLTGGHLGQEAFLLLVAYRAA